MELIFDESNLERVAEIVRHFNPYARSHDLVSYMKRVARESLTKPGYIATGGWMLTAFTMEEDNDLHIRASISDVCFHNVELG